MYDFLPPLNFSWWRTFYHYFYEGNGDFLNLEAGKSIHILHSWPEIPTFAPPFGK